MAGRHGRGELFVQTVLLPKKSLRDEPEPRGGTGARGAGKAGMELLLTGQMGKQPGKDSRLPWKFAAGFHILTQLSCLLPSPGATVPVLEFCSVPEQGSPQIPHPPPIPAARSSSPLAPRGCSELWVLPSSALSLFGQSKTCLIPPKVTKTHFPPLELPISFTSRIQQRS